MSDTSFTHDQRILIKHAATAVAGKPKAPLSICIDVSAGITTSMRALFRRITTEIADQNAADIHLFFFDMEVRHALVRGPHQVGAAMDHVLHVRGGGTNFNAVLRAADEPGPSLILVFSDMFGFSAHAPKAPIVWAAPKDDGPMAPAPTRGTVIHI